MTTTFQINKSTTRLGKTVKAKVRLKAIGVEGTCEATVKWDTRILRFIGWKSVATQSISLLTNESNLFGGVIGLLMNPVPNAFAKTKGFVDIVELTFEAIAAGTSPVIFEGKTDPQLNCVSHITSGAILQAKWIDGRVNSTRISS